MSMCRLYVGGELRGPISVFYFFRGGEVLHDQEFKSFLLSSGYNSVKMLFNFLKFCKADETAMNCSV